MTMRPLPMLLVAIASLARAEDAPPAAKHIHVVAAGETLADIATREYGTSKLWKRIVAANPDLDPSSLKVGQELVLPEITVADPTIAPGAGVAGMDQEAPEDELAERRDRHANLVAEHPRLDGGGIADAWQRALSAAEDAQRAVPSDERAPHVKVAELYGVLLDRELELDQLLDRMEAEAAVLDTLAALRDDTSLDADGAKAKRAAAMRGELLAALARQHALQRDALALRHHSAMVEAEAEDKDAEAEKAGSAVEAMRAQLEALGGAEPEPERVEPMPQQEERGF